MAEPLSLVINAGGESRRMGRTKALLPMPVTGKPLIHHIVRQLAPLVTEAVIVVVKDAQQRAALGLDDKVFCLLDHFADGGPLGGMATGLRNCTGWALTVACDLPLINPSVCRYLVDIAGTAGQNGGLRWQAVTPIVDDVPQPLHALYHAQALPAMEKRLAAGERRAASFLADIPTRWVTEDELRPLDPELRSFVNVNTPAEWAAVRPWLGG